MECGFYHLASLPFALRCVIMSWPRTAWPLDTIFHLALTKLFPHPLQCLQYCLLQAPAASALAPLASCCPIQRQLDTKLCQGSSEITGGRIGSASTFRPAGLTAKQAHKARLICLIPVSFILILEQIPAKSVLRRHSVLLHGGLYEIISPPQKPTGNALLVLMRMKRLSNSPEVT